MLPLVIIVIVVGLGLVILALLALIIFSNSRNTNTSGNGSPTLTPVQGTIPGSTSTSVATASEISGSLTYPAGYIPGLDVCAHNIATEKEYCVLTADGQLTFSIDVIAGDYLVYASDGSSRAYYTQCDTYDDPFIPECNPNAGPDSDNGKWNQEGFVCFQDPVCKAAFTPLVITVGENEEVKLNSILQGWYIPCSYSVAVCSGEGFDPWKDYLD